MHTLIEMIILFPIWNLKTQNKKKCNENRI